MVKLFTAYNIHEHHDLDTNFRAFSFELPDTGFILPGGCVGSEVASRPRITTELTPLDAHLFENIYECDRLFVVIDNNQTVHTWSR